MVGRPRWTTRLTVEDCLPLDIESFRHAGTIPSTQLGASGEMFWTSPSGIPLGGLDYVTQTTWHATKIHIRDQVIVWRSQPIEIPEQRIEITTSKTNFGGERYWFYCGCWRQVGKLYLPPGKTIFRCRRCYNLTYRSAQQHDHRVYDLARDPSALQAALASEKIGRRLLALHAFTLHLNWASKGRLADHLSKKVRLTTWADHPDQSACF